jgi:LysM repeat protein
MNNPNPFIPQGSLVEQMNKKRARVKMAVLAIFSGTIVLIAPVLLIQGCKRDQAASDSSTTPDTAATVDTNTTPNLAAAPMPATTETNVSNNAAMTAMPTQPVTPPVQPVAQPPTPSATTYVILPHDIYATIAKKFSVKVKDLEAANPTMPANKLKIGSTINIPASGSASPTSAGMASTTDSSSTSSSGEDVYTVKAGDNLTKIAHTSGTSVKALMAMNNLATTRINVGQKLKLPAKTTAASPMETMPAATTTTTASNPTSSGSPVLR